MYWRHHTGNAEELTGCEGKPVLAQLTVLLPAVFEPLQQTGESSTRRRSYTLATAALIVPDVSSMLHWTQPSTGHSARAPAHVLVSNYMITKTPNKGATGAADRRGDA